MWMMRRQLFGEGSFEPLGTKSPSPRSSYRIVCTRLGGEANRTHRISQRDMERL